MSDGPEPDVGRGPVAGPESDSGVGGPVGEAEEVALFRLAPVPPDGRVAYGDHPDQVLDLYRPARGAVRGPLVVLLHGGFWRAAYDRTHLSPLAAALAGHGLPVALAEYRRAGGGGGLPETFEDVRDAVATAAERALTDTGCGAPVVVAGHSAGGQLALWAASRAGAVDGAPGGPAPGGQVPGGPAPGRFPHVAGVVAVAPVADLARAHELRLSQDAVTDFLGAVPGGDAIVEDERTVGAGRTAGPTAELITKLIIERIAEVDPVQLPPPRVPVIVLHGTADPDVPVDLSRRYASAAAAGTGGRVVLRQLPDVAHYAPVTPGTPAFDALLTALHEVGGTADTPPMGR